MQANMPKTAQPEECMDSTLEQQRVRKLAWRKLDTEDKLSFAFMTPESWETE